MSHKHKNSFLVSEDQRSREINYSEMERASRTSCPQKVGDLLWRPVIEAIKRAGDVVPSQQIERGGPLISVQFMFLKTDVAPRTWHHILLSCKIEPMIVMFYTFPYGLNTSPCRLKLFESNAQQSLQSCLNSSMASPKINNKIKYKRKKASFSYCLDTRTSMFPAFIAIMICFERVEPTCRKTTGGKIRRVYFK